LRQAVLGGVARTEKMPAVLLKGVQIPSSNQCPGDFGGDKGVVSQ
jgi:hypothetical protein